MVTILSLVISFVIFTIVLLKLKIDESDIKFKKEPKLYLLKNILHSIVFMIAFLVFIAVFIVFYTINLELKLV